ncbi:DM13 domain-containing protein [Dryocola clanedunensis]|uniref:DM13 domain-containing protein n=1 Tax=Cedecea sulfonylureivorans TaxID=3051154 RepID=UPI001927AD25|nr:DM13 domain-containing protein [Cedecea sulfonylureivorans]
MKKITKVILLASHLALFGVGIGVGIYILPVLTAESDASTVEIQQVKDAARYTGLFDKNQKGSNAVHWVDGKLYVTDTDIAFEGSVAPGPDYKIYLSKTQADDRQSFLDIKDDSLYIGDLKNFGNFKKSLPNGVNLDEYTTVQIWCERFEQFIGSAKFK